MKLRIPLEYVGGDDGSLLYFYRCRNCGTVVIEDHRKSYAAQKYDCPVCNPDQEEFPFEYVRRENLDNYKVSLPVTLVPVFMETEEGNLESGGAICMFKKIEIPLSERLEFLEHERLERAYQEE